MTTKFAEAIYQIKITLVGAKPPRLCASKANALARRKIAAGSLIQTSLILKQSMKI